MLACAHAQHCGLATLNGPPDAPKQASCSGATTNCSPTGYARDAAPCAVQAQSNCVSMKAHMNAAKHMDAPAHQQESRRAARSIQQTLDSNTAHFCHAPRANRSLCGSVVHPNNTVNKAGEHATKAAHIVEFIGTNGFFASATFTKKHSDTSCGPQL